MNPYKGLGLDQETNQEANKRRRNRLFMIGINQYKHWQSLRYPVSDCDRLFKLLETNYGFEDQDLIIEPLYDEKATADIIYDELYRLQEKGEDGELRLGPDENLILVFSGHGYLDEGLDEGYWVPVDAPQPERPSDLRKLVSVSEVVKILSKVKAHHIVLIVDACFSGAFARMEVDVPGDGDPNNPEEKPSRWVLTAGRLEQVLDDSPFAKVLRQVLANNSEARISIDWVGAEVMRQVGENEHQHPWCGTLVDQKFAGGAFYFHRNAAAQQRERSTPPAATGTNLSTRLRRGSATHLQRVKKGRFKLLRIERLLLTDTNLPELIDTQVQTGTQQSSLYLAAQSLWEKEKRHLIVLGEGGMGKTVSLVRIWEDLLAVSNDDTLSTIPVFIALNEFNAVPETEKSDFILRSIARNCGLAMALTEEWKNAIWELLQSTLPDGSPAILLLLDGFNEVTIEKDALLTELHRLSERADGVQMMVTSRYIEIQNFSWARSAEIVELIPLAEDTIQTYLEKVAVPLPQDEDLRKLLSNPMMLTLFVGSSRLAQLYKDHGQFRFLPNASYGELLWNFHEAQLAKQFETFEYDRDAQLYHLFLLRCLLPYLAYRMEVEGQFFLPARKALNPDFNFKTLLDEAFTALNVEALTEIFPSFEGQRKQLGLGEPKDLDAREQRSLKVREYLVEKLHLLVVEDDVLRFVHQNFRDFFAAAHLRNRAALARINRSLPTEWKERTLPVYLRQTLGEIEGEHHIRPANDPKTGVYGLPKWDNLLSHLLNDCRGRFEKGETGFLIWNVIKILEEARGTLAGIDLSRLDLRSIHFNGLSLSVHQKGHYLPAILQGSLLHGEQFFFNGHYSSIHAVLYGPQEQVILSASKDHTIREWSLETGICLRTFKAHDNWVLSIAYSADGNKMLSASKDCTIKEWSVETGACLRTYSGHRRRVVTAAYSPDGKKILSASFDRTLREWSVATGDCLQIYEGHTHRINHACYKPDGTKILSTSGDQTIKEWSVETGKCLRTLQGHSRRVTCATYSPDEERILSASGDKTIREWSTDKGDCLREFRGHTAQVLHVTYSPDGKKILSTSEDQTLREWSVSSGQCLKVYRGHFHRIHSAVYSPDGRKILSASDDKSIMEWSCDSGAPLQKIEGQSNWVSKLAFTEDGKKMLSVCNDKTVSEWWLNPGICLQSFRGHRYWVRSACFHPDGHKILTASDDRTIREWSLDNGRCLQIYEGHIYGVRDAVYNEDGSRIFSLSGEDTFMEHEVGRSTPIHILKGEAGADMAKEKVSGKLENQPEKPSTRIKGEKISIRRPAQAKAMTIVNETGLLVQACDFRNLHQDARFTEEEKVGLRRYGAIFEEKDLVRWEAVLEEAFGNGE